MTQWSKYAQFHKDHGKGYRQQAMEIALSPNGYSLEDVLKASRILESQPHSRRLGETLRHYAISRKERELDEIKRRAS